MPIARIADKVLFFAHVPKTGGASIETYMALKGRIALKFPFRLGWSKTTAQHMHADIHRRLVPESFCDQSFAVVRDPMERLMSEFRYRSDRGEAQGSFESWAITRLSAIQIDPSIEDNHLRPQTDFLRWNMLIFLFEDGLDPVFDWIDSYTNTSPADRTERRNVSKPREITFSPELEARVRKVYARDYALIERLKACEKLPVRFKKVSDKLD